MDILKWFKKGKDRSALSDKELIDSNICPNCWGTQEYEDQFFEYVKDRQKDVINKDKTAQRAFIEKFVDQNISGIRLKKQGAFRYCSKCVKTYK